jgi:hypothetical protein
MKKKIRFTTPLAAALVFALGGCVTLEPRQADVTPATPVAAPAAPPVVADGQGHSAVNNLYANLARIGLEFSVKISDTTVTPTLVRGMYHVETIQGKHMGYTNEAGTLWGGRSGFEWLPPDARQFRRLTPDERDYLRREMVSNIDKSKLIKVRSGNGQRQVLQVFLFSAIDCPASQKTEEFLRKNEKRFNATFYIIPSSLNLKKDMSAAPRWQKVAKLWCADNSGDAWKKYWVNGTVPAASQCPFSDYKIAEAVNIDLRSILEGAGLEVAISPFFMREDGIKISLSTVTTPPAPQPDAKWLAGGVSAKDFRAQRVIVSKTSASGQTGAKTIKLGDVIQGLFK